MSISNLSRHPSLLVVDDNHDAAESLAFMLSNYGYDVSIAYDGNDAIRMIDNLSFQVVVCDIGLPGRSGYEVGAHVRRRLGDSPLLVAVSGYSADGVRDNARQAGFNTFFSKPADPIELEAVLRRYKGPALGDTQEVPVRSDKRIP